MAEKKKKLRPLTLKERVKLLWAGFGGAISGSADTIASMASNGADFVFDAVGQVVPQAQALLGSSQMLLDPNWIRIGGQVIFALAAGKLLYDTLKEARRARKARKEARLAQMAPPLPSLETDAPSYTPSDTESNG